MKFRRSMAALLLVVMLGLLVAACGKKGPTEIVVGLNFELSGDVASFGQSSVNGVKLAFEQIGNELLGLPVKLVEADNKSDATEAANAATKLIEQDKAIVIIGPVTSTNTISAANVAQSKGVPIITPTGTNPKVTEVGNMVFRACFIDPFQGTVAANFASNSLGAKTAAVFFDNGCDYCSGLADFFKQAFTANGGTIVAEQNYAAGDQDFKAQLTNIKAANPDVVFVPGYYEAVGRIVKQGREMQINGAFLGGDGWDAPQLVEIAGAANLNNTYFTNHYSPEDTDPRVVEFVSAYQAKYNAVPDALAALAYDAALMVIDAVKRAGEADPAKIAEALAATKDFQAVSGLITLDANRNPVKGAVIIEMKDGKQTFREKVNPSSGN